jgi:starvation-inducible DNA-binding protein
MKAASGNETRRVRMGLTKRMHHTHNSLPEKVREQMVELLNARLADTADLAQQVRTAHWNVKGPQFIALHKLFDEIYEDISEHMDTVAERCAQLGGTVLGTMRVAAQQSQLPEYPLEITQGDQHVAEVAERLGIYGELCRNAIEQADKVDDQGTSDMFTEIVRMIDQWTWFVEAHQQAER